MRLSIKRSHVGLLYVLPWIIGFLVFQLYPLMASLVLSFTRYRIVASPEFIGLGNFIRIFTADRDFYQVLRVTFIYVFIAVPVKVSFALMVALILNMNLRGISFFRTVYYLPSIFGGSVAVAILWRSIFMREGLLNSFLSAFSLGPVDFLGNPRLALYTLSLLTVWQFGSSMVVFLAGLKQVPTELYEAARVDGASRWKSFWTITLPLVTPLVLFNTTMQTILAFQEFTGAFVITRGGPMRSTYLYGLKLYEEGFGFFRMGYASALSWFLFIVIFAVTALLFFSSRRWVYYEDSK